ncbi:MAG: hypothetical protein N2D54_07545 [Chloroflexota bacterium]
MDLSINGIGWLLLTLGPLLFLQPRLHKELQVLFYLITQRVDVAIILFSAVFFPGVVVHELSHYFMAKILRVQTGRVSLIPRDMQDGRLMLGFVEVAQTDILRETLIGAAPLLTGSAIVAYAGIVKLKFNLVLASILSSEIINFFDALVALPQQPDFFVWLYLAIAVSSTMMPSKSDRRAWLPVIAGLVLVFGLAVWAGAGSWLSVHVWPWINARLTAAAGVFAVAVALHIGVLLPIIFVIRMLNPKQ